MKKVNVEVMPECADNNQVELPDRSIYEFGIEEIINIDGKKYVHLDENYIKAFCKALINLVGEKE